MGIGCGGANLNRLFSNKPLNGIGQIFKDNAVGQGRYHLNPMDSMSMPVDRMNPVGFLAAGGQRSGSVMSQLAAAGEAMSSGQQSFGRLFQTLPKAFRF